MLSLFLFILGLAVIFFIAKWNHSVTLFWLMLLSYVAGVVGNKSAEMLSETNTKQSCAYVVTKTPSTQLCCINLLDALYAPEIEIPTCSHPGVESLIKPFVTVTNTHSSISSSNIRGHPLIFNSS